MPRRYHLQLCWTGIESPAEMCSESCARNRSVALIVTTKAFLRVVVFWATGMFAILGAQFLSK